MNHLRICFLCFQPRSMRRTEAVCLVCVRKLDRELHTAVREVASLEAQFIR